MARSLKKGPYVDERLLKKVARIKPGTVIKTWARAAVITPEMIGHVFGVHNGKTHVEIKVVENMVGHRLGEFASTRRFVVHGGRMAKEQAKAVADKEQEVKKVASATASK
ncbi:MAG: 30S ribosomal protein S19 [Patescibacteria group bacterium]